MSAYAELEVTSNYSFLHGASHPEELMVAAKTLGLSALGLADRNSLAGAVRGHVAAKAAGRINISSTAMATRWRCPKSAASPWKRVR